MTANFLRLIDQLESVEAQDDVAFARLISESMMVLRLEDKDLAEEFDASRPTIARWKNGQNAPQSAMRRPVLCFLIERAKSEIIRQGT